MKLLAYFLFVQSVLFSCKGQEKKNFDSEYKSVDAYFEKVHELEKLELIKENLILDVDSFIVSDNYRKDGENRFNKLGRKKYLKIKGEIYPEFFKNYLYQQHIKYENEVYALYFTMAGFDDMQWKIFACPEENWSNHKELKRNLEGKSPFKELLFSYDEGKTKNYKNARMFIKNDYLVFERGNLCHSLYDLKNKKVVLNVENPYSSSLGENQNDWIRVNLHEKIKAYLATAR